MSLPSKSFVTADSSEQSIDKYTLGVHEGITKHHLTSTLVLVLTQYWIGQDRAPSRGSYTVNPWSRGELRVLHVQNALTADHTGQRGSNSGGTVDGMI